ncbi:MAG: hypothetical protein H7Z75_12870 [Ferruginibacter sp.]|nr:hypothetical protein [Cytophagales bacterium]
MKTFSLFKVNQICTILLCSILMLNSSCKKDDKVKEPTVEPPTSIQTKTNDRYGEYLTDAQGKTLYIFSPDVKGNASTCTGGCLTTWPLFYSADLSIAKGLDKADFSNFTRSDGQQQTAYKGWPLYFYSRDLVAGDVNGENVGGVWYYAKSYSLMIARQGSNRYLSDVQGRTLYLFTRDAANVSNCSGGCAAVWPVFFKENLVLPSSLTPTDFGTITRTDQNKQLTYKGAPLYYYQPDVNRADTLGQGVNGVWFKVRP